MEKRGKTKHSVKINQITRHDTSLWGDREKERKRGKKVGGKREKKKRIVKGNKTTLTLNPNTP